VRGYSSSASLLVYTQGDPQQLLPPVRDQIRQLDSGLPVFDVTTMNGQVQYGKPLLPARLGAMLVGAFGLLGLVLASVGVFGVVSYSVSQRTHEIGIRSTLGAQRSHVLAMILRQGMSMAFIGTAIGVVLSFLLFRGLSSGSTASSPLTSLLSGPSPPSSSALPSRPATSRLSVLPASTRLSPSGNNDHNPEWRELAHGGRDGCAVRLVGAVGIVPRSRVETT
jgi:FtsX-like permease family